MIRAASTYSQTLSNNTHCSVSDQSSFAGKEKDSESGYHYFGARYYDSEVLTGWLSVDPMADKYPNISPFAHCAWTRPTGGDEHRWIKYNIVNNPVKLVDPDGREYGDYYDQNGEYLGSDGLEDNKVYQLNKGWRAKFENTNVNWGGTLSERHYKELQSKSTCLGTVQDAFVTGDPTSDKNIQSLHPAIRMKATYFIKEANVLY